MIKPFLLVCCAVTGLVLGATGCKSSSGQSGLPVTASGLPEITVRTRADGDIKRAAGEFFVNRGYVETRSSHLYEIVFDKPTGSGKSRRALRVRLRMHKETDDTWRLVGAPMGVEGWRTDLESETVLLEGASQIQGFLGEIKRRAESTNR